MSNGLAPTRNSRSAPGDAGVSPSIPLQPKASKRGPNAQYTALDDKVIVEKLLQVRCTYQSDSGFRPAVWNIILVALLRDGSNVGGEKTTTKVSDYFGTVGGLNCQNHSRSPTYPH